MIVAVSARDSDRKQIDLMIKSMIVTDVLFLLVIGLYQFDHGVRIDILHLARVWSQTIHLSTQSIRLVVSQDQPW